MMYDVNIDDCMGVNCGANRQCVDGINSFTCDCDPGFTGAMCDVNIDKCLGQTCGGNGQCIWWNQHIQM